MVNLKYLVAATLICTSVFAQFVISKGEDQKESLVGKIILKDKAGADLEIKSDSKPTVTLLPSDSVDKLILSNRYQIKFVQDKQEVIYDVEKKYTTSSDTGGIEYLGFKEDNKQSLNIRCYVSNNVKNEKSLTYTKVSSSCIKNSGCKSYVLGADKKFKLIEHAGICMGKKEVETSTETPVYEEKLHCMIFDEVEKANRKNEIKFSFTRALSGIKEKHTKPATGECK